MPPALTSTTKKTLIATGIPGIGTIDYSNPIEIAIFGGVAASVFFAPGIWKIIVPVGLLVLRNQMGQINTTTK
jgi:hypothetical protein